MWSVIILEAISVGGYFLPSVICSAKSLSANVRQMSEGKPELAMTFSQSMDITS